MTEQPLVSLEAADLVLGARNADYGHPLDDFSATAEFWTTYLRRKGIIPADSELDIEAEDIGPLMILLKVSRQAEKSKHDNLVDICGYANTTQMVEAERELRWKQMLGEFDTEAEEDEEKTVPEVDEQADFYTEKAQDTAGPLLCGEGACFTCDELRATVAARQQENPFLTGLGEAVEAELARQLGLSPVDLAPGFQQAPRPHPPADLKPLDFFLSTRDIPGSGLSALLQLLFG